MADPSTPPDVIIYTDGGCIREQGIGGWAALLISGPYQELVCSSEYNTTNNRMELSAVNNALGLLQVPCVALIYSDSKYVTDGINYRVKKWFRNKWRLNSGGYVKNADLWQRTLHYMQKHNVRARHVKGHSGDPGNETVDWFAQHMCGSV